MGIRSTLLASFTGLTLTVGSISSASATESGAISLAIDPSVRSRSMGGASTAVFWGEEPDAWANPALLGSLHGLHYEYHNTQTIPSLNSHVYFTAERVDFGGGGIGLSLGGKPHDRLGRTLLDYGDSRSFEGTDSWSLGVDAFELFESLLRDSHHRISRWAEISLGYTSKSFFLHVGNLLSGPGPGALIDDGHAHAIDRGVLVRLTPFDTIERDPAGGAGMRLQLAYGRCVQNRPDTRVAFDSPVTSDPIARHTRDGIAARWALGASRALAEKVSGAHLDWLVRDVPVLDLGLAWDRDVESFPSNVNRREEHAAANAYGMEARVLNLFNFRLGYERDREGGVDEASYGLGLAIQYRDVAGIHFDWGRFAVASSLTRSRGRAISAFIDGMALMRARHGGRPR